VLTTPDSPAPPRLAHWLRSMWGDIREALKFVFHERGPRAAFLAMVIFALFATPVLRFLPLFVTSVYFLEEETFGILTGILGVGAVAGGFAMKLVPAWYPRHHFIPFSTLLGGVWILLFSITSSVWAAGFFMFFVGVFWMWTFNSCSAAIQMLVDDSMRGRVMAVCNTAALGLMPIGNYVASAVGKSGAGIVQRRWPELWEEGLKTQIGVGFVALILIGAGIVMLIWRTPEVDGLRPGDPGYDRTPGFWRGLTAAAHRPAR
jgi:predicted MFS family arabinose efflux permease